MKTKKMLQSKTRIHLLYSVHWLGDTQIMRVCYQIALPNLLILHCSRAKKIKENIKDYYTTTDTKYS